MSLGTILGGHRQLRRVSQNVIYEASRHAPWVVQQRVVTNHMHWAASEAGADRLVIDLPKRQTGLDRKAVSVVERSRDFKRMTNRDYHWPLIEKHRPELSGKQAK